MPVYNGEHHLSETIKSILEQSFREFEFIIIDDASQDHSWRIIEAHAMRDPRIAALRNDKNLGHQLTSNKALALALGEFIARQDQDDISLPERLDLQVDYLDRHSEVGLVNSAYYRLFPDGQRILRQPAVSHTGLRWRLLFDNVICHSAVMLRRQLLAACTLPYRDLPGPQDYDLWVRLIRQTRAATLTTPLVLYRMQSDSMTAIYGDRQAEAVQAISSKQIQELLPERVLGLEVTEALRRCHSPRRGAPEDLDAAQLMLELFAAFQRQPDINPMEAHRFRRHWIERMIVATPVRRWPALAFTGFLGSAFRVDPAGLGQFAFFRLPARTVRRLGRRGRA